MKITIELTEEELKGLIFGKEEPKNQSNTRYEYDLVYESRNIAERILEDMKDIAKKYGYVSVAEFKDLSNIITDTDLGLTVYYLDHKQGWTYDMLYAEAYVIRTRAGYALRLPKPLFIE